MEPTAGCAAGDGWGQALRALQHQARRRVASSVYLVSWCTLNTSAAYCSAGLTIGRCVNAAQPSQLVRRDIASRAMPATQADGRMSRCGSKDRLIGGIVGVSDSEGSRAPCTQCARPRTSIGMCDRRMVQGRRRHVRARATKHYGLWGWRAAAPSCVCEHLETVAWTSRDMQSRCACWCGLNWSRLCVSRVHQSCPLSRVHYSWPLSRVRYSLAFDGCEWSHVVSRGLTQPGLCIPTLIVFVCNEQWH